MATEETEEEPKEEPKEEEEITTEDNVQSNEEAEEDTGAEYTIDDVHSAIDDLRTLIVAQTELISSMICDGPAHVEDIKEVSEKPNDDVMDDTILEDLDYNL